MTQFSNNRLISALEKITAAQQAAQVRMQQGQEKQTETHLMRMLIDALAGIGRVSGLIGPKGDKGDRGFTGPAGEQGPRGEKGDKGDHGKDGERGEQGPAGEAAAYDPLEMLDIAVGEVNDHKKEFDHTLLHKSDQLGPLTLDEATIAEGKYFQVQGGKIVCVDLPKVQQIAQPYYNAQQGVSNVRSFTVTASRELDAMGIYIIDATAGDVTITVPSASGRENHWFELIRIDSSSNTVTISPTGTETLSEMTTYQLQQWSDIKLFAFNGNYLIRGN